MPTYVTGHFDAQKLQTVIDDLNRAALTLDALIKAMKFSEIETLEIPGVPELNRSLAGINTFGDFGHSALRKINLGIQKNVPEGKKVSPKSRGSVGEDAPRKKRKKSTNHG